MADQSTFDRVLEGLGKPSESALSKVFEAYQSGKMSPNEAAAFEADVRGGKLMLPSGKVLKGATPGASKPPVAPAGIIAAYNDGRMSAADKAQFDDDVRNGLWSLPENLAAINGSIAARIPGGAQMQPVASPEPGIVDKAIGVGEAALTAATGGTGGAIGLIGGTLKGLAEAILSGNFGTREAANLVEQSAARGAQALTYEPRGQVGQEYAAEVGKVMQQLLPIAGIAPTMPKFAAPTNAPLAVTARAGAEGVARDLANTVAKPAEMARVITPGAAGEAAAGATAAAINAAGSAAQKAASVAKTATTLPKRALERLRSESESTKKPDIGGSVGAAETEMALQRIATAENLPVPIKLTKGQATRDSSTLKFEVESAKLPDVGKSLRERALETSEAILANFDHWADQTGALTTNKRGVGQSVIAALEGKAKNAKAEIKARYELARKAGEMEAPVSLDAVVQHLNESAPDAAVAPLLSAARARAIQTGIAYEGKNGELISKYVPLRIAETFRQAIGAATDYSPTNIRQATIIKSLVDQSTDGIGGRLYKEARAARSRYAQEFEDRAVISKLINNKRGTNDRQVALEDVLDNSIYRGSLDDVRFLRKVLQTEGEKGKQAWREIQGATLRDIREKATQSATSDSAGNAIISADKLNKAIKALDEDGKLEFIFGKKGAETLRDIRDLTALVKTVPPEAAINMSNTATTLMAFGDVAGSAFTGLPLPALTAGRMTLNYIKDQKLRKRIEESLNYADKINKGASK